ncbi:MAG: DUF302 domain-containing protein [Xanthobacteraceae bacterium]
MIRSAVLAVIFAVAIGATAHAELVRKESPYPVKETIDRLEAAIKQRGLAVIARVDHSGAANKAGLELRPTELIIFGSAAVGTPLMQAQQTMGLSLPMKALSWQDAAGQVWLGYDEPATMAAERRVPADHPVLKKIDDALRGLAEEATKR